MISTYVDVMIEHPLSEEQKSRIVGAIAQALADLGIPAEYVYIDKSEVDSE